jgi:hypothetical protein
MVKKTKVIKKENNQEENNQGKEKIEQVLIENFVSLQKVMTNLAVKFDSLSNQISKLLELFEISAKTLAEKDYFGKEERMEKKLTEKLDNLLDQNKVIAKGIALLHEKDISQDNINYMPKPYQEEPSFQNQENSEKVYSRPAIDLSNHPRFRNREM